MTSFLFWNLRGQFLGNELAELAGEYDLDVIVTAEPYDNAARVLATLNRTLTQYRVHRSFCPRIQIFSRFPEKALVPLYDDDVLSISRLQPALSRCNGRVMSCLVVERWRHVVC